MVLTVAPAILNVVRTEKWKKAMYDDGEGEADGESKPWKASHYKGRRPRVRDAFGSFLPVLVGAGLWVSAVLLNSNGVLIQYTRTVIWLGIMMFSKLITHLHVAHVCGEPYYQWRKTFLIPVTLLTINTTVGDLTGKTLVSEAGLLFVSAALATVSWVHMAVNVVRGMCQALNIPFLSVPKHCIEKFRLAKNN